MEKNEAAVTMAKLSHKRFEGMTPEQKSDYFKSVRAGKKGKALKVKLDTGLSPQ